MDTFYHSETLVNLIISLMDIYTEYNTLFLPGIIHVIASHTHTHTHTHAPWKCSICNAEHAEHTVHDKCS